MKENKGEYDIAKIANNTALVFFLTFLGLGLNYIYGIVLARMLGINTYGLFSLGFAVFNVLSLISVMGLDSAVLRFCPKLVNEDGGIGVFGLVTKVILLGGAVSVCIGTTLFLMQEYLADNIFNEPLLRNVLALFSMAIPSYVLSSILFSVLQAKHKVKWRMFVRYVSEPIMKMGLTVLLLLFGWQIEGALWAYIIALWMSVVLAGIPVIRLIKNGTNMFPMSEILQHSIPLFVGLVFTVIAYRSDFILLGYYMSIDKVGMYAAAFQTAAIISIIIQSVESTTAPHLSESIEGQDKKKLEDTYALSLRWMLNIALPIFSVFIIFSEEILGLFGDSFKEAYLCFTVLTIGQIVNIATGSANYMLLLSGRPKTIMINSIAFGTTQVVLNLFLIPNHGIVGAALAMLISVSLINIVRLIEVYIFLRVQPYKVDVFKSFILCLIMILVLLLIKYNLSVYFAFGVFPLMLTVYLVSIYKYALKEQDRDVIQSMYRRVQLF